MSSIWDRIFPTSYHRRELTPEEEIRAAAQREIDERASGRSPEIAPDVTQGQNGPLVDSLLRSFGGGAGASVPGGMGGAAIPQALTAPAPVVQQPQPPAPAPVRTPPVQPAPVQAPPPRPQAIQPPPAPAVDPSQTPMVRQPPDASGDVGILGRMFGFGDQSPDPRTGLTPGDRGQLASNTLGHVGAMLMAAGQPISPGQRAQIYASMGNIPANTQAMTGELQKQRAGAIAIGTQQMRSDALREIQKAASDPSATAGLTPAQQALLKSAFLLGDLKTAEQLVDPAKNRPRVDGNGYITTANGSVYDAFGRQIVAPGGQVVQRGSGSGTGPLGAATNAELFAPSKIKGRDESVLRQIAQEYGPETAQQIRAYADYKVPFSLHNRTAAMANPNSPAAKMLQLVTTYAPDWKQSDFDNQKKLWNEFYGSGKTAGNITALDTAYGHLGDLYDLGMALGNNDVQGINMVTNKVRNQLGDPKVNNAAMAAAAVGHELAKVFRDSGMSQTEIEEWNKMLSTSMSPAQITGAVYTAQKLMESRVHALKTRYERAGGDANSASWFTPSHVEKAEQIKAIAGGPRPGAAPQAGASTPPPQGTDRSALEAEMRRRGLIQ